MTFLFSTEENSTDIFDHLYEKKLHSRFLLFVKENNTHVFV